jgi:uncharacterized membrane protein
MNEIFGMMAILGGFTFLGMGFSVANSIEGKKSEKVANIMTIIMVLGMISCIIGFFGLLINN